MSRLYQQLLAKYSGHLRIVNELWGLLCIFVIMAMIGILGYWIGQPQFFYAVTQSPPLILDVSTKGSPYHPNVVISGAGKATYTQWIESLDGERVYEYKPIYLESSGSAIKHEQIIIPPLPVGIYYVKAEMVNQINPIKSTKVDLILGVINVIETIHSDSNTVSQYEYGSIPNQVLTATQSVAVIEK